MENSCIKLSKSVAPITLSLKEELKCYKDIRSSIIKLLYMIEAEQQDNRDISLFFYGCIFEISSSNILCHEKLTKVLVKIYGLYENNNYKTMSHAQIKRQIMESKGILDHLIKMSEQQLENTKIEIQQN